MKQTDLRLRLLLLGLVLGTIFSVFSIRLLQLQIVSGEEYLLRQQRGSSRRQMIKAARGEIVDRNGSPFSYNEARYDILFDRALAPANSENETIWELITVLRPRKEGWVDHLPLEVDAAGIPQFTDDAAAVQKLKSHLEINSYASAADVFFWLQQRYQLSTTLSGRFELLAAQYRQKTDRPLPLSLEGEAVTIAASQREAAATLADQLGLPSADAGLLFAALQHEYGIAAHSPAEVRDILAVRYEMERTGYSISQRYTFSEDIALETAIFLRQINESLPGVDIVERAKRSFHDGELAPHIVGRVGAIFADELDSYLSQDRGYTRDDLVGKDGIERAFESVLRGTDGVRRIDLDAGYQVVGIEEEKEAIPGSTVVLTLDKNIQRVAMEALEREIRLLNETAPAGQGKEADAGAVAVIDVKNSSLLAAVSYPGYNLETFSEEYADKVADPLTPFLNRAFSGIYAPGSCFKPVTAVAGLNENIVTPETTIQCTGVYHLLRGYSPTCLSSHGQMTVADALRHSCNIYFYDTGYKLGIETINDYARKLGLGVKTGIELSEAAGTQCSPQTANPGDALQAAIGQLDNGYTPIQLANYTATIARRGVRTRLSLVKAISSYFDYTSVVKTFPEEVLERLELPEEVFATVIDGMVQASQDVRGTAYRYLGDYPIPTASKTGTPQTKDFPNSTFICFAPVEDPEIAIAVVIEKGWHGYTGAPVARSVLDAYFFPPEEPLPEETAASSLPETAPAASEASMASPSNPVEILP